MLSAVINYSSDEISAPAGAMEEAKNHEDHFKEVKIMSSCTKSSLPNSNYKTCFNY